MVSWTQGADAEVRVAYSFDADVWLASPLRSLAAGAHDELFVGIPYGVSTTWRLVDAAGASLTPDTTTANGDPWWRVVYDIPTDRHEDADRDERAR